MHQTRVEIHKALQAVAVAGHTLLPPQEDHSEQSFTFSPAHDAFVQGAIDGCLRVGVRLGDMTLLFIGAGDQVLAELPLRGEYADAKRLADLYAQAAVILEDVRAAHVNASPVRLWPHHFDVATLIGTTGMGFLAGDGEIEEPYWYVYNTPMPDPLPELSAGEWHRGTWTGAVLTGTPDRETIVRFLGEAIAAVR